MIRCDGRTVAPSEGVLDKVNGNADKCSQPRSDYIHSLHGRDYEGLMNDWSVDDPHHRGSYEGKTITTTHHALPILDIRSFKGQNRRK